MCKSGLVGQERTSLYRNVSPAPFAKIFTKNMCLSCWNVLMAAIKLSCHLQAVADLIKANEFAGTYHWWYMEEVFLMKKDKDSERLHLRSWASGKANQLEFMQCKAFFNCKCEDLGAE